jgi:hypothetical protein
MAYFGSAKATRRANGTEKANAARRFDPFAVSALAEAMASIDGKLGDYKREQHLPYGSSPETHGEFLGYQADAEEMICRLRERGFDVVAMKKVRST